MRRRLTAFAFVAGFAACQSAVTPYQNDTVEIAALAWIDSAADRAAHLSTKPATCLSAPDDPAVQRGALLFASPLLLGGQAAKSGLSCAACHRNGRGNPEFMFTGISGLPGTADVTHGLFSNVRADRIFNPVEIPDLATETGRTRVDRGQDGVLETFLTAQIVEEFSGTAPKPETIADLAAYIRALDDRACDGNAIEPQSWQTEIDHLRAGLAYPYVSRPAYVGAMRSALGRLHNRLPRAENNNLRAELVSFSRSLAAGTDPIALKANLQTLSEDLKDASATSYYNPVQLEQALR